MSTIIGIINAPSQEFSISVGSSRIRVEMKYSYYQDRWVMDIYKEDVLIAAGIKVLINRLLAYDLGIGAFVAMVEIAGFTGEASRNNMVNGDVKLLHLNDDEISSYRESTISAT